MRVHCAEEFIQFRLLSVACGTPPGPWLDQFLAPESIPEREYVAALRRIGRPWQVSVGTGPVEDEDAVEVFMVEQERVDVEVLDRHPALRRVVVFGGETTAVDLDACRARGIEVRTVRRPTTDAVADHTMLLVLALVRRFTSGARIDDAAPADAAGAAAATEPSGHPPTVFNWRGVQGVRPLAGMRLAVVGAGEIGSQVLRRAHGFGMTLGYASRRPRPHLEDETGCARVDLAELAAWADVASLHVGYDPSLRHLVDRSFLEALGPRGFLVNTSRGRLVDEEALEAALRAGGIAGAGLDVFDTEPLAPDHPLRTAPNAILTPHVGGGNRWTLVEEIAAALDAADDRR